MSEQRTELPDGTRVVIRGGPREVDVAAIVAALARHRDQAAGGGRGRKRPAWRQAALREGLGRAPAAEPGDLRGPH